MHTRVQNYFSIFLAPVLLAFVMNGCAGRMARQDEEQQQETAKQQPQPVDTSTPAAAVAAPGSEKPENPRATVLGMSARLDALEAKMSAMNDKLDATRNSLDNFLTAHQPRSTGVPSSAADTVGIAVSPAPVSSDRESGFVSDDAIQQYRKAQILLESQKYPDAVLGFSSFLEKYPDHALAGSAQFHIGESYFKEKQYRQADQEFQKVITSYDRSVHVADTLRYMAAAEDALGETQNAARHRQQLSSLFANSPAAAAPAIAATPMITPQTTAAAPGVPATKTAAGKGSLDEVPPTTPVTAPITDSAPASEKNGSE